jgi:hypothetical protein
MSKREHLKNMLGERLLFKATVAEYSFRYFKDKKIPTILLKSITKANDDHVLADHLWFTLGKSWANLNIGDVVQFEATVSEYEKGYKGVRKDIFEPIRKDYKLTRPTKIKTI